MVDTNYEVRNAEIVKRLEADGWVMTYACQDAGGLKTPSVWAITLTHQGKRAVTEYTKGAAHRHWRNRMTTPMLTAFWQRYIQRGERVQSMLPDLKDPEDCQKGMQQHQRQVFTEYAMLTKADPPTLDEVMYSLVMDASSVRYGQSFDDFCQEFGYSNDSISARENYDACVQEWQGILRMGADLDVLQEMFQDY